MKKQNLGTWLFIAIALYVAYQNRDKIKIFDQVFALFGAKSVYKQTRAEYEAQLADELSQYQDVRDLGPQRPARTQNQPMPSIIYEAPPYSSIDRTNENRRPARTQNQPPNFVYQVGPDGKTYAVPKFIARA